MLELLVVGCWVSLVVLVVAVVGGGADTAGGGGGGSSPGMRIAVLSSTSISSVDISSYTCDISAAYMKKESNKNMYIC